MKLVAPKILTYRLPSHIDTEVARNCRKSCNNVPRLDGDFFTDLEILGHKL